MTTEGADRQGGGAARPWRALQRLSRRTPLGTKLIAAMFTLVAIAVIVISVVGASFIRSYLIGQQDQLLQGRALQHSAALAAAGDPGAAAQLAQLGYAVWWLPDGGSLQQVVQPSDLPWAMPQGDSVSSLSPAATSALAATPGLTMTVPGATAGDRWRVISIPSTINGTNGTVIVGTDVSSVYNTIRQLIEVDVIVGIVILFVLLIMGYAVVRANLRPLVDIEETAGEIADGHLNRRVPERDPRTEVGSLGRSLNMMLSQIEAAFHAREESEAAAHQSEERMRRFIADASHELRTPLTAIRGFAEYYRQRGGLVTHWNKEETVGAASADVLAIGGGLTPDDLDRIMQRVEKEAARMGLLVEDLLLLARLDQQRPLAMQPIDLLSLAADAVHDARLLAPSRTIELSVQPGSAFLVTGDEARLRQVIGNLMSNALTHTPDGSPIEVSIGSGTLDPRVPDSAPAVTLDVTDHGPGMAPEQAHRVFERFYRADQARTRATGGSGLGLAIVSALVAAHGGVASVRTAPGRGATFRIALPLAPEAQGSMAADDDADFDEADELSPADEAGEAGGHLGEADGHLGEADGAADASVTYGTGVAGGVVGGAEVRETDPEAASAEEARLAEEARPQAELAEEARSQAGPVEGARPVDEIRQEADWFGRSRRA
jgi:two-component system, OmpR family, sensor kinase